MSGSAKIFCAIQSLHLYPIKSMGAVDVDELVLDEFGPQFDREWMLVDDSGQFLSQRQLPQLARLRPRFKKAKDGSSSPASLRLELQGQEFELPIAPEDQDSNTETTDPGPDPEQRLVRIWKNELLADVVQVEGINEALSDFLGRKCGLVRYGQRSQREVSKGSRPRGAQFRFADSSSLLITNQASLDDLNSRLSEPIPMTRFRPNIVLNGASAWQEDQWASLKSPGLEIEVIAGCGRCVIINKDQQTGETPSREPLLVLSEFRKRGNSVDFGALGVHRLLSQASARICRGDRLEISLQS